MADALRPTPQAVLVPARRSWSLPMLRELPKLTQLTLASAIGGTGGTGGSGSTVFGILLALGLLVGCAGNDALEPGEPGAPTVPTALAEVKCDADLAGQTVSCGGGPSAAAGQVILGGQGTSVILGTNIVQYNTNDSTFVFQMKITNLSAQVIGWGWTFNPTGIRIVFQQNPTATVGTGAITFIYDSIGTFTAANQHYYVTMNPVMPMGSNTGPLVKFHVPPTVLNFSFTVLVVAEVPEARGPLSWQPVAGRSADALRGVAAAGPSDVLAVGMFGSSRRWDGTAWHSLVPYTQANFNAVASLGGGEYVAVTDGGEVWRLKGKIWTKVYTESHGYDLTRVWARNGGHFVAAGEAGATVTWSGGSFTEQVLSAGAPSDTAVAVTGKSDGSAVSVLLRSNTLYTRAGAAPFAYTEAITGEAGGVVYDENDQLLWTYFDSGSWEGVVRLDATEILRTFWEWPVAITTYPGLSAVIAYYNPYSLEGHVDQVNYGSLPPGTSAITGTLSHHRIQGMSIFGSTLYMATTAGALLRWNAGGVHDEQPISGTEPEFWGIGDTTWVVTGNGSVGRIVNGVLTERAPSMYGSGAHITGTSSTDLYTSDGPFVERLFGNTWGYEVGASSGNITGMWGDTATSNLVVLVSDGEVLSRTWGGWHYDYALPAGATKIWGCSYDNVWISVGSQLWRWNGTTASQDMNYASNYVGGTIRGISGTSCTDVWAVDDYGVAHFNGSSWSDAHHGTSTAVISPGPGVAWLLNGTNGGDRIGRPDGNWWNVLVPTQGRAITAAWVPASGGLLVAGNGFLLWGNN